MMSTERTHDGRDYVNSVPGNRNNFLKPFVAGVVGWIVGTLVLFGISWFVEKPESLATAVIWTISRGWASFLFGLTVLIAYSIATRIPATKAAFAYLMPVAVLAAVGGICLLIYPDATLRDELLTYLPVVLVFYLMGLVWMKFSMPQSGGATPHVVIPALVGGLVILGFVAVPIFGSDAFRYRDTFNLKISNVSRIDGVLRVEGAIEILKPGSYRFAAPRYVWTEQSEVDATEPELELGEITWGSVGEPQAGATGIYPMKIAWKKGAHVPVGEMEDYINIEVRNPDEQNRVVHSMDSPLPGS